jgi:uncharacterized protein YutE (UPF0331/DUF86 family)
MTPTGVDLKVVAERLDIVRTCLSDLRALAASDLQTFAADRRNPAAAESFLRRALEALFDTARHLLAKGLGLGRLEYREVARLSVEHGLLSDVNLGERFVNIAGFRNRLTHYYDEVTPPELFAVLKADLDDIEMIATELQHAASRLAAQSAPPDGASANPR